MADEEKELEELRRKIDTVDLELLRLINARADLAVAVGKIKRARGGDVMFYRPEREATILRRVLEQNPGPLTGEEAARLMREVMSACLALENPLNVSYLGPEGTYTHLAALKHFGGSITGVPVTSIEDVMREVEAGGGDFGVVPIENSLEGGINQTLDGLRESPLKICGEVVLDINHQLLTQADELDQVKQVYAHSQALAQCRRWLSSNVPAATCTPVSSNGEAARIVQSRPDAAAIASAFAADLYTLKVLRKNIEDAPGNTTRFVVLGHQSPPPSGRDVTSVMFITPNRPGALLDVLSELAASDISMTRIESRPLRQEAWDYVFFVDIDGHAQTQPVRDVLAQIEKKTTMLKILGAYPRAVV